jgi:hypothetical protein
MTWPTWEQLKQGGSDHYKTGGVEPIDLYRSLGILIPFCIASIIKYASRMLKKGVNESDCGKIVHYVRLLMANHKEQGGA